MEDEECGEDSKMTRGYIYGLRTPMDVCRRRVPGSSAAMIRLHRSEKRVFEMNS